MKKTIQKNNPSTPILSVLFLLFFMGNNLWVNAQTKDPLIVEKDIVEINNKLQVNDALQVNLNATFGGDLSAKGATFGGNLTVQGATFTAKDATITGNINNAFIGDVGHTNYWAGFSHKDAKGTGSYGLLQSGNGLYTLINKAPGDGGFIGFRVNNQDKMVILNNGNVGIGTTTPGRPLEINNALKLTNSGADINDGVIGTATFAPGLNIVGIKTDNTHRKISLWGEIIQWENSGTNSWKGNQSFDGKVGIGTTSPKALLHVAKQVNNYNPGNVRGLAYPSKDNWNNVLPGDYNYWKGGRQMSIIADGDIISKSGVFSASDIRIKKNIHPTSTPADLQSLKGIEVVNYEMIDHIADNRSYKKVIAQQLQEVYPLAVQQATTDFIPSVFQPSLSIDKVSEGEYHLSVAEEHQLVVNDLVDLKCYPDNSSVAATVSKIISPTEFVVTSETDIGESESIFIYGKQVNDLLSVDYDAISMLNVSATQELAKQTEQLRAENKVLQARVAALEKQVEGLEELKASVAQLQAMMQGQKEYKNSGQASENNSGDKISNVDSLKKIF